MKRCRVRAKRRRRKCPGATPRWAERAFEALAGDCSTRSQLGRPPTMKSTRVERRGPIVERDGRVRDGVERRVQNQNKTKKYQKSHTHREFGVVPAGQQPDRLVADTFHRGAPHLLHADGHRLRQLGTHRVHHRAVHAVGRDEHLLRLLRAANLFGPRLDVPARARHRLVALLDGVQHLLDGEEIPEALDHHHRVFGTRQHQVQPRALHLLARGIDERLRLAREEADADAGDGLLERDVRDGGRGGRGGDRQRVRGPFAVVGKDPLQDLGVVGPPFGYHGSEWSVDEASDEGLVLAHAAVAFAVPPRGPSHGAVPLLVVDGERDEAAVGGDVAPRADCGVDDSLALGDHDGTVRLAADAAGLDGDLARADLQRERLRRPVQGGVRVRRRVRCGASNGAPTNRARHPLGSAPGAEARRCAGAHRAARPHRHVFSVLCKGDTRTVRIRTLGRVVSSRVCDGGLGRVRRFC